MNPVGVRDLPTVHVQNAPHATRNGIGSALLKTALAVGAFALTVAIFSWEVALIGGALALVCYIASFGNYNYYPRRHYIQDRIVERPIPPVVLQQPQYVAPSVYNAIPVRQEPVAVRPPVVHNQAPALRPPVPQPQFYTPPQPKFYTPPQPQFHVPPQPQFHVPPQPQFYAPPQPQMRQAVHINAGRPVNDAAGSGRNDLVRNMHKSGVATLAR